MKSGKLRRVIKVQRNAGETLNEYGTPVPDWVDWATLRAEIVERSTEEFMRNQGAVDEAVIVFRTRYLDGVTNAHQVAFDGGTFGISEVTEIGNRKGLELRCRGTG